MQIGYFDSSQILQLSHWPYTHHLMNKRAQKYIIEKQHYQIPTSHKNLLVQKQMIIQYS